MSNNFIDNALNIAYCGDNESETVTMTTKIELMCETCIHNGTSISFKDGKMTRYINFASLGGCSDNLNCSDIYKQRIISGLIGGDNVSFECKIYKRKE